jgi:hypothetical protein
VVQVWLWMFFALVAAAVVMLAVLRIERRNNPEPTAGLRGFVADFRAGWADIRAERIARKHPEQAQSVAAHLAPAPVDADLGAMFEWAEPDDQERESHWHVRR